MCSRCRNTEVVLDLSAENLQHVICTDPPVRRVPDLSRYLSPSRTYICSCPVGERRNIMTQRRLPLSERYVDTRRARRAAARERKRSRFEKTQKRSCFERHRKKKKTQHKSYFLRDDGRPPSARDNERPWQRVAKVMPTSPGGPSTACGTSSRHPLPLTVQVFGPVCSRVEGAQLSVPVSPEPLERAGTLEIFSNDLGEQGTEPCSATKLPRGDRPELEGGAQGGGRLAVFEGQLGIRNYGHRRR